MSAAELLLAAQLDQAGIPYEREYRFAPPRRWRADFVLCCAVDLSHPTLVIEVDGATWTLGRHNHPSQIAKEYERTAAIAIAGFRLIRATTAQVNDGSALKWIRQALGMEEAA